MTLITLITAILKDDEKSLCYITINCSKLNTGKISEEIVKA